MSTKNNRTRHSRRSFIKQAAIGGALGSTLGGLQAQDSGGVVSNPPPEGKSRSGPESSRISFPRVFTGSKLRMIAFPLGGIGTGTISLGGRGQLLDWEIFNRPDKGNMLSYCFPAIWAQVKGRKAVARVLEGRMEPPYQGSSGLGADNVPGLPRLRNAIFKGAFPFAEIDFEDDKLPVQVSLEAFNPMIPLDVEGSGLPIAVLRYSVKNPASAPTKVGIALSIQNPVGKEGRQATFREEAGVNGLYMENPFLPAADPFKGSFVLATLGASRGSVSHLRGWKGARWWDGALTFWDDFTDDGALDSKGAALMPVGSLAITETIPAGQEMKFTFMIAWHFPNRTPERCGWKAVEGKAKEVVGNYYTQRFPNAWEVARHAAGALPSLESRSRRFVEAIKSSTLPAGVLDAAVSNLSTLVTNTAFRTPDGEFHAFEGCDDHAGCCHGSCTHVWNYEQATGFVFPQLARSLRESEFLRNTRESGLMGFRSSLPDGIEIWDRAAADGQMGCIMKLYRDWQLSGDSEWLRRIWPKAKQALEFAWIKNGWDGDRDGVMEGVQHNTYDVEFYGPNPLSGVWYLGALRAGEEMARAVNDADSAATYRKLFENGKKWIDANLFNGEYYIQKVVPRKPEEIAEGLKVGMGASDSLTPDYQMGEACLVDQLLGQYMAHVTDLGYLLDPAHVKKTLQSIVRYNFKTNLMDHEAVQRIYALNDEGGVLIGSYGRGQRPAIPFPYYAEVWTGNEYQLAAHLIYEGMSTEALAVVEAVRRRHDGERRNPWNEPECGHHYARAMSSWAVLLACSGFHYSGVERRLKLASRIRKSSLRSFWSIPSGWGTYARSTKPQQQRIAVEVTEGKIALDQVLLQESASKQDLKTVSVRYGTETVPAKNHQDKGGRVIVFEKTLELNPEHPLAIVLS